MPSDSARSSFSRMAMKDRPKVEFTRRFCRTNGQDDEEEDQIEIGHLLAEIDGHKPEVDFRGGDVGEPHGPFGEIDPVERHEFQDLGDPDRHDDKIRPPQFEGQPGHEKPEETRRRRAPPPPLPTAGFPDSDRLGKRDKRPPRRRRHARGKAGPCSREARLRLIDSSP